MMTGRSAGAEIRVRAFSSPRCGTGRRNHGGRRILIMGGAKRPLPPTRYEAAIILALIFGRRWCRSEACWLAGRLEPAAKRRIRHVTVSSSTIIYKPSAACRGRGPTAAAEEHISAAMESLKFSRLPPRTQKYKNPLAPRPPGNGPPVRKAASAAGFGTYTEEFQQRRDRDFHRKIRGIPQEVQLGRKNYRHYIGPRRRR